MTQITSYVRINSMIMDVRINTKDAFELSSKMHRDIVHPCSEKLEELSQRTSLIRLAAPMIGIFYGSITLIEMVGTIFEMVIKGSINTCLGVLSCDKSMFGRGMTQIIIGGGLFALTCIPAAVLRAVKVMVRVLIDPVYTFNSECESMQREQMYRTARQEENGSPSHFIFRV
jgi:hypothetical protein